MSRIYDFLSDALRAFEEKDDRALGELMIQIQGDTEIVAGLSDADNQIINELEAAIRKLLGKQVSATRLSVTRDSFPSVDDFAETMDAHIRRLSREGRRVMFPAFSKAAIRANADSDDEIPAESPFREAENEALESLFARELIDLLPDIVRKGNSMQMLEIGRIPNKAVQAYFHEAHRCYLYGLQAASLAMCRAILESSLRDLYGQNKSALQLEELAKDRLDDERLKALREVKEAGNLAIHNQKVFKLKYSNDQMDELFLDTRKILEDLYSKVKSAKA